MKRFEDIDTLLEKYFEGDTSLEEEKDLRLYFSQADIADEHKVYAPMFQFFVSEQKDNNNTIRPKPKAKAKKRYYQLWIGAAASILIAICGIHLYNNHSQQGASVVYIDGHLLSGSQQITEQAVISISNVSNMDDDATQEQIDVLNLFTGR